MGRAILSRRRGQLDGQGRCQSQRRYDDRQNLFHRKQRLSGSSNSPRRGRFLEQFLLLSVSDLWPWLAVFGLGIFHGINPAMGWLFAVALGLQEQKRAAVFRALPPMVLGHALSIGIIIAAVLVARVSLPHRTLKIAAAAILFV